ncbi:MAG: hypothetical protein GY874_13750 [Desulfobacteraceae bacterium]|nr:hypothetical protein [Desulfobacteraceae bacterium]
MAEGLLQNFLPEQLRQRVNVSSAGTMALHGHPAAQYAIDAMDESGIGIHSHRARQLTREIAVNADLLLAMETEHLNTVKRIYGKGKAPVKLMRQFEHEAFFDQIADPYGGPLEGYRICRDLLQNCMQGLCLYLMEQLGVYE